MSRVYLSQHERNRFVSMDRDGCLDIFSVSVVIQRGTAKITCFREVKGSIRCNIFFYMRNTNVTCRWLRTLLDLVQFLFSGMLNLTNLLKAGVLAKTCLPDCC